MGDFLLSFMFVFAKCLQLSHIMFIITFVLYQKEMAGKWAVREKKKKMNNRADIGFIYSLAL